MPFAQLQGDAARDQRHGIHAHCPPRPGSRPAPAGVITSSGRNHADGTICSDVGDHRAAGHGDHRVELRAVSA
jgi:hypothetical protein